MYRLNIFAMKTFLRVLLLMMPVSLMAQSGDLTLTDCISRAKANYPLAKSRMSIDESARLRLLNLQSQYYPQFDVTGQMTWQNDVPHVAASGLPFQMPTAPNDQYKAYLDVKQVIYDGGATSAAKKVEQSRRDTELKGIEVELRQVEAGVIQAWFVVLSIDKQLEQMHLTMATLEARLQELDVKIKNGWVLSSQGDQFRVELLQLQQRQATLVQARLSAIAILNEYSGMAMGDSVRLQLPFQVADSVGLRPELAQMSAQLTQLEASQKMAAVVRMPRVSAFAQLGYGNPGFNMLMDSFEPFYMVGLRLNWTLWDWQRSRHDRLVIGQQQQMVQQRQEAFVKQQHIQQFDMVARIEGLRKTLLLDEQIIALRQNITQTALSQFNNGTITASDYISRLNEEAMARLSAQLHQVELSKLQVELAFVNGLKL